MTRQQRHAARAKRVESLPYLLDTYGPCGSATVAAVRSQTAQSERDRALISRRGPGGLKPLDPNRRLAAFGMRVELASEGYRPVGGTARQRACYMRAVQRWMLANA